MMTTAVCRVTVALQLLLLLIILCTTNAFRHTSTKLKLFTKLSLNMVNTFTAATSSGDHRRQHSHSPTTPSSSSSSSSVLKSLRRDRQSNSNQKKHLSDERGGERDRVSGMSDSITTATSTSTSATPTKEWYMKEDLDTTLRKLLANKKKEDLQGLEHLLDNGGSDTTRQTTSRQREREMQRPRERDSPSDIHRGRERQSMNDLTKEKREKELKKEKERQSYLAEKERRRVDEDAEIERLEALLAIKYGLKRDSKTKTVGGTVGGGEKAVMKRSKEGDEDSYEDDDEEDYDEDYEEDDSEERGRYNEKEVGRGRESDSVSAGIRGSKGGRVAAERREEGERYWGRIPKALLSAVDGTYKGFDPVYSKIRDSWERRERDRDREIGRGKERGRERGEGEARQFVEKDDSEETGREYDDDFDAGREDERDRELLPITTRERENKKASNTHSAAATTTNTTSSQTKSEVLANAAAVMGRNRLRPPSLVSTSSLSPSREQEEGQRDREKREKHLAKKQREKELKALEKEREKEQERQRRKSQEFVAFDFVHYEDANSRGRECDEQEQEREEDMDNYADDSDDSDDEEEEREEGEREDVISMEDSVEPSDSSGTVVLPPSKQLFTSSTFSSLGLFSHETDREKEKERERQLVTVLEEKLGVINPTRIQALAIPAMLGQGQQGQGQTRTRNVVIHAQTGSGKTLAYLLPLLDKTLVDPTSNRVQAIILAPSRELVQQIHRVAETVFSALREKERRGEGEREESRWQGLRCGAVIGGTNLARQIEMLRSLKPQVLVATPGRLAEIVFREKKLRLSQVRVMIVDEVDQLLREQFVDELKTIIEATPLYTRRHTAVGSISSRLERQGEGERRDREVNVVSQERQREGEGEGEDWMISTTQSTNTTGSSDNSTLSPVTTSATATVTSTATSVSPSTMICLASATAKDNIVVEKFADQYCLSPTGERGKGIGWQMISVENANILPATITHSIITCSRMKSFELLRKLLHAKPEIKRALIFVNDPHRVEFVCEKLRDDMGLIAAPLHGESSKEDRKEVLSRIRDGRLRLVVTTEIAARGLDIPDVTHVINFELPTDAEHYVHRSGRCGRAGKPGLVINFCTPQTKFVIRRFAKQLRNKIFDCDIREGKLFLKKY